MSKQDSFSLAPKAVSCNLAVKKKHLRRNFKQKLIPNFILRKFYNKTQWSNEKRKNKILLGF